MTFRDLGLIAPILSALDDQGYVQPSPIQEKAIPPALEGRDVLGCAQTGTGKTCAFAAPILQRLNAAPVQGHPIRALILTPTRELAIQIGENIQQYGKNLPLRSTVIFGGVGQWPQVEQIQKGVDILVATPGRLGDLYQQKLLDLSHIEIFVLDEADRMLDMGFIHDVKKILKWLPVKKQTLFFSATMPTEITKLVDSLLHDPARVAVNPVSSPVEIIEQSVYFVDKANKTRLLAQLVREQNVKNALVFTRTKHGANKVARDLSKEGITAAAIHGNKSQTARQQALADFKAGKVQCLVATDIAARGLDIEELSHVFNYNLPEVPETYVHRIGRTGRAGHGGKAIAFCDFSEKPLLKDIEKLTNRTIPVVEGHPFPMQVLEAPKRDKFGRVINEEDTEARAAAKELRRQREEAKKTAAEAAKAKKAAAPQTPESSEQTDAPAKRKRRRRKAKPQSEAVEAAPILEETVEPAPEVRRAKPKLTRPGKRLDTGDALPDTEFDRPDPLAGDRIMDATARLLAPRRSVLTQEHSGAQRASASSGRKRKKPAGQPKAEHAEVKKVEGKKAAHKQEEGLKAAPHKKRERSGSAAKAQRKDGPAPRQEKRRTQNRGGNRRGMPMEPMKSGQTKDSTEQQSLMKPYYLDMGR